MNCRNAENLFSAFIEDELSEEERRSLETHLMACRRCALSVKELRATLEAVASLPSVETTAHFEEDVMDRIRSGEALRPSLIEWLGDVLAPSRLRPVFLAGAAVCAAWIAVLLVHPPTDSIGPSIADLMKASPSANHKPDVASSNAGSDATTPPAPASVNAAPEAARSGGTTATTVAERNATPDAAARVATPAGAGGDYAWADHEMPVQVTGVDSTLPNAGDRYQDEYILDQFYLNRTDQDGVHSIVPVSGNNADDVYITF
ncbi:MAG: zf-HC2 domain-containing protein [Hyphomicrobiales bacterium]